MTDKVRIESKPISPLVKRETPLGFLVFFVMVFTFGFIFELYSGYETIDAAKESLYVSIGIMIGSTAGLSTAYMMAHRKQAIVIDGKYLYMNSGSATLWQVRLASLVSISIDEEHPIRPLRLHKPSMVRLKTVYDTFSFGTGVFEKDAIELVIKIIQKHNPSFYLVN